MDRDDMPEGLPMERDGMVEGRPDDGLEGFVVGLSGFAIGCSGLGLSGLFGGL
jgi:hypothetical protein